MFAVKVAREDGARWFADGKTVWVKEAHRARRFVTEEHAKSIVVWLGRELHGVDLYIVDLESRQIVDGFAATEYERLDAKLRRLVVRNDVRRGE